MIPIKTPEEIEVIKAGGKITAFILKKVLEEAKPGVRGMELENLAELLLDKFKVKASFKTVKDYPFALCLSLNEEVVHGLPGKRRLEEGDLLSIDLGVLYKGFHADMARSIIIPNTNSIERFLEVGQEALTQAIKQARVGNHVGHISQAIQRTVEEAGFCVVRTLTGHGVGKKLHEDPQIPCFLQGNIKGTPKLKEGMVLAIEVMYTQGKGGMEVKKNGWTVVTKDGSLSGHFENTIAVTKKGPIILTR